MRLLPRRLRRSVLPVHNHRGAIGTATVIAEGLAMTALHVVVPEDAGQLSLGVDPGVPVRSVETVPLADYADVCAQAFDSYQRNRDLVSVRADGLHTVDLALLVAPGLSGPSLRTRRDLAEVGEPVVVAGYPRGHWHVTRGPVIGVDGSDFAVRLLLGPGASGAPVLDHDRRVVGVVTLSYDGGVICVGPRLISTFLARLLPSERASRRPSGPGHSR